MKAVDKANLALQRLAFVHEWDLSELDVCFEAKKDNKLYISYVVDYRPEYTGVDHCGFYETIDEPILETSLIGGTNITMKDLYEEIYQTINQLI